MLRGALTRRGNRHLMIALTVALGACVATSMLSVMFNVGDKVNQELKSYGANIVVRPQGAAVLDDLYSTGEATDAVTEPTEAPTEAETTTTTAAPVTSDVGYVNATTMHIRSGPGTDYGAIGGLKMGDQVKILGKEGDWYKIEFKETGGYVSAQFIQGSPVTVTTTAPADDIPTPTTASVPQE